MPHSSPGARIRRVPDDAPVSSDFPALPDSSPSLLKKYLTPEVWAGLKDRRTAAGVSLHDCIRSGLVHPDSAVGLYAGDADSYDVFAALFAPVIAACHAGPRTRDTPAQALANPDPHGAYIVSTRLRLARNLSGHLLRPVATRAADLDVERAAKTAFSRFTGDLAGGYRALCDTQAFHRADRYQDAGGLNRNWPDGRGVFANTAQTFSVWVNEEDHLRFISITPNADIAGAYARLRAGVETAGRSLSFQHTERLGHITSCPTNLGPALRAGFRIKLPLSGGSAGFDTLCRRHHLTVRGAGGEHVRVAESTYEISSRARLGLTDLQCLHDLLAAVAELIDLEKNHTHA